jgi:hypothetical protein
MQCREDHGRHEAKAETSPRTPRYQRVTKGVFAGKMLYVRVLSHLALFL